MHINWQAGSTILFFCNERFTCYRPRLFVPVVEVEDAMRGVEGAPEERPLKIMSEAFRNLAVQLQKGGDPVLRLEPFSHACARVSILFNCLGIAFKFAEKDYTSKVWLAFTSAKSSCAEVHTAEPKMSLDGQVNDLMKASSKLETLPSLIKSDVEAGTVKTAGSHTRNLLRVKRGVDLIRVLFEGILDSGFLFSHTCVFQLQQAWARV